MKRLISRTSGAAVAVLAALAMGACGAPQSATATTPPATVRPAEPAAPTAQPTPAPMPEPTAAPTAGSDAVPTAAPAAAGSSVASPDDAGAVALERFLLAMHEGRYEDAAALYGGDYGMLQMYNPDLPAEERAGLLKQACEVNGFTCLAPNSITQVRSDGATTYYDVTFLAPDGSIFGFQTPGDVRQTFGLIVQETPDGPRPMTLPPFVS